MPKYDPVERRFLKALSAGYDPSSQFAYQVKENWKHASKSYFEHIARELNPDQANIWFNPGGNAVSGDIAMQVWKNGVGFHLFGNLDFKFFTIRKIEKMGDYIGRRNYNLTHEQMKKEPLLDMCKQALGGALG